MLGSKETYRLRAAAFSSALQSRVLYWGPQKDIPLRTRHLSFRCNMLLLALFFSRIVFFVFFFGGGSMFILRRGVDVSPKDDGARETPETPARRCQPSRCRHQPLGVDGWRPRLGEMAILSTRQV